MKLIGKGLFSKVYLLPNNKEAQRNVIINTKTMTNYQQAKQQLKTHAKIAKEQYRSDKPAIRQTINDDVHFLSIDYKLNDYQTSLLSNYASKLHP